MHSEDDYETAVKSSEFLFGNGSIDFLNGLSDDNLLGIFDGIEQFQVSKEELSAGVNVVDLLGDKAKVFPSKSEAKKMIQGGGVSLNKTKVGGVDQLIDQSSLINNKFIVAQKGKKNYFLLIAE
ncbi:Tyrosine--tRNA ligase [compost metagenome]